MLSRVSVSFLILVMLAAALNSLGQKKKNDWRSVEALGIGTLLWVETKNNESVFGSLVAVSSSGLELKRADGSGNFSFGQTQIKKIHHAIKRSQGRLIGIGTAIGAGVGLGIGLLAASRGEDANIGAIFFPLGGAGAGAAVGAASAGKITKGKLIFEAN